MYTFYNSLLTHCVLMLGQAFRNMFTSKKLVDNLKFIFTLAFGENVKQFNQVWFEFQTCKG